MTKRLLIKIEYDGGRLLAGNDRKKDCQFRAQSKTLLLRLLITRFRLLEQAELTLGYTLGQMHTLMYQKNLPLTGL